jgi:transcriptional regulator with XRE-family HTH domain
VEPYDPEQVVGDLGRRIAEMRTERGLTQVELANRLRYSVQHVSQLENGTNVTVFTLARIANALGVRLSELLEPPQSRVRQKPGRPPLPTKATPSGDRPTRKAKAKTQPR